VPVPALQHANQPMVNHGARSASLHPRQSGA
jgi:hypothetical protein